MLHSPSPQVFGCLSALDGTDTACIRIAARTAEDALSFARRIGMHGLSVVSPSMEAVSRRATAGDESPSRLGAANTVLMTSGAVPALNTEPARVRWALTGMMGAGKSTAGRELSRRLDRELADIDDLIVERTGHDIRWLFDHRGEEEFRRIEADTIARVLHGRAGVIALGGGSLEREATAADVRRSCQVVWLSASPSCLAARLAADTTIRPLLDRVELEPRLASLLAARTRAYASAADLLVDAEQPLEDVVDLIACEAGCLKE